MPYKVLGINFGGHDTSACITIDGELIAAIAQERFDLEKHSRNFPSEAIADCLKAAQLNIDEIDEIALTSCSDYFIRERYLKPALNHTHRVDFLINDIERIKAEWKKKGIKQEYYEDKSSCSC